MDSLLAKIIEHEGSAHHIYADHLGNCTTGVGFLLRTQSDVLRYEWSDVDEAVHDWAAVRAAFKPTTPARTARWYKKLCNATLLDVETPLRDMVWSFKLQLQTRGLPLDTFPLPVQEAVIDITYNVGVGGLFSKFPKFVKHLKARDFAAASTECRRPQVSAARNAWTRAQLQSAV